MIGVAPPEWWRDGAARVRQILTSSHAKLRPGQRVTIDVDGLTWS